MSTEAPVMAIPGKETDETVALVLRARSGERDAFGELVERYWPQLVSLARGVLAADAEVEDVVQDALVHAWQRLWTLRHPERFSAWLRRIVTRRCLTRARRRRETAEVDETATAAASPGVLQPGTRLDAARLLALLAPRQRAALYLTWIEGCTDREAGRLLGLRPATVRVHRHRGLQRLRLLVEEKR